MTSFEFRELLYRAVDGNHDAIEQILSLYMPLINRSSIVNGHIDEDCRQYIMMHVAINIGKFKI